MPRPTPTPRQQPGRVAMQVARDGGPAEAEGGAVPSRGRHRTPDTGELSAPDLAGAAGAGAGPAASGAPSRHDVVARQSRTVARRTAPGALERVEAAQVAASRPASAPRPAVVPSASAPAPAPSPRQASAGAPAARSAPATQPAASPSSVSLSSPAPSSAAPSSDADDDAVTDLVAGPTRRGRAAVPDGPSTGRAPGVIGLVLGVLALLGAVVAAAAPDVVVPVVGRIGASPLALAGLLALGLLATACAGLGTGRQRRGRGVAVTGMVVGLAAVAAAVVPLVAVASL
ncbi:hypothetical protein LQ327_06525 [Actinomycetospora endophytica]|uniref:Meckel syndrome type 1 protein n=1 Tax=Actinomycetospora endophytica TaxID=2291215 RepID=A0ABS8P7L7_9PSEU|nr:hypothetical protein [Actinomycetospora endophytica]MCD2193044.1 hypothetical protein [Actinomycetospora endophytica]